MIDFMGIAWNPSITDISVFPMFTEFYRVAFEYLDFLFIILIGTTKQKGQFLGINFN